MNFRTLDLNLLRVFDTLMAEGSLTRAAEVLSITQPAASHALKRLHDAVGEPLFTRTATGMKPSARAESLWPQVRVALAALRQALVPEEFDAQRDPASFRVAMVDANAALLAPRLVAALETRHADAVALRILPLATRDPRPMLRDGEADLAIGHFPDAVAAIAADAEQARERHLRLDETRYVCAMRRGHPLASGELTLDAYCAARHLLVSVSGRGHGLVDEALASLGRQRRVVLSVNQFFTAGEVIQRSDLLMVLPTAFIGATGNAERIAVQPLPFELAPVTVEMVWPRRQDGDPAHRWLRELVLEAAGLAPAET
ncbi:MAG: LysR family transcriptional regulator [Burkholderiales bacterium]|nr:LysR family transcriptional regulator [Burkholderiales bacterium]